MAKLNAKQSANVNVFKAKGTIICKPSEIFQKDDCEFQICTVRITSAEDDGLVGKMFSCFHYTLTKKGYSFPPLESGAKVNVTLNFETRLDGSRNFFAYVRRDVIRDFDSEE